MKNELMNLQVLKLTYIYSKMINKKEFIIINFPFFEIIKKMNGG